MNIKKGTGWVVGQIGFAPEVSGTAHTLTIEDTLSLNDSLGNAPQKIIAETLTLTEALSKTLGKSLADTASLVDAISKASGVNVSDTLSLADAIENFKIITSGWEFVEFEKILINEKCGYGGTADAIVQIDGIKALVDFKTSSAIYPEHYLQVAAYMECLPECTHAYIVHLDKETNGWEVLEAKTEGLFPVFQAAQVIYKHLKGGK